VRRRRPGAPNPFLPWSARAWRTLFQVRSSLDRRGPFFGRERPLYLRSQTYDRIEAGGLRASPEPIDVLYGEPSGAGAWSWMVLDERADLDGAVEFTVVGYPLRRPTGRGDLAILLHRAPVAAVQVAELHRFPSGPLLTTATTDEPFRYRWMNELEAATAATLDGPWREEALPRPLTGAQADPRYLQLPEDPSLLPWLDQVRATRETDPRARIAEVLRRYEPYRYSRVVGEERGFASLLAFRERRQGYCTYFATAVALELRALGIPCRLVGGFRVTRWSPTAQAYLGSAQEAHLWVEVPTAAQGWVALETTPGEELDELLDMDLAASTAAAEREKARIAAEAEEDGLKNEETPFDLSEVDPSLLDMALEELAVDGGPTADEWTLKHWFAGLAGLLLLPLLFPLIRSFQRGSLDLFHRLPEEDAEGGRRAVRMPATWDQVLERLDHLGYRRRHSQTTSEFAREVAMERRVDARALLTAVRRKERFRFGDRDWKPSDEEAAQALLAALDRLDEKADGGPEAA
jgi:transglutaminase-like putative cysteine protease